MVAVTIDITRVCVCWQPAGVPRVLSTFAANNSVQSELRRPSKFFLWYHAGRVYTASVRPSWSPLSVRGHHAVKKSGPIEVRHAENNGPSGRRGASGTGGRTRMSPHRVSGEAVRAGPCGRG